MKYTEQLLHHPVFIQLQEEISELERDRIYCHHELNHSLDVCRIAWSMWLEAQLAAHEEVTDETLAERKDFIYVTGLLHDVGRSAQYRTGEDHAEAGLRIAESILTDLMYPEARKQEILQIIKLHTGRVNRETPTHTISYYIREADHLSRNCFLCRASDTCKWSEDEKNSTVLY